MNVVQLFYASVIRNPNHPCLQWKENGSYQTLSYQDVWAQITQLAAAMEDIGVRAGDKVAIFAPSSPRWTICDLAAMAIGAVVVPIYPSVPTADVNYILTNADVRHLITAYPDQLSELADNWSPHLCNVILLSRSNNEETSVHQTSSTPASMYDLSDLLKRSTQSSFTPDHLNRLNASAIATIVHTSGTSGPPKGVMLSHENLSSNVMACLSALPVTQKDVALSYLPLSHIFERTVGHFCVLTGGGTIAYAEGIDQIRENLLEVRPTVLVTVPRLLEKVYAGIQQKLDEAPSAIRRIVAQGLGGSKKPLARKLADKFVYRKLRAGLGGQIRVVISGGAALSQQVNQFYLAAGIPVCEGYGMTESSPVIAFNPLEAIRPGTVGMPIENVNVNIAEDGELLVKGPNVMQGYYGNPEATKATITPDGWLHTGDIAEIVDGYVRIIDRKKHLIVLATGKNVAPAPIESAISLSPAISDCVLVGDNRKYVGCIVVPDEAFVQEFAKQNGFTEGDSATIIDTIPFRSRLQTELQHAIQPFASFEQPKRALVLSRPFTIDDGDLTPTLKVKAKKVLAKYANEIDDMYEGITYLDIFGDPALGLKSENAVPQEVEAQAMPSTQRKRFRWWIPVSVAIVLAGIGLGVAHAGLTAPKNLNLLSTIRHVHNTNQQINNENKKIVAGMSSIQQLSSLTPEMEKQLSTLNQAVPQQNDRLSQLRTLSDQEIGLSKQFAAVATELNTDLKNISSSTKTQSQSVANMNQTANHLANAADSLQSVNQKTGQQLNQADHMTNTVNQEIP